MKINFCSMVAIFAMPLCSCLGYGQLAARVDPFLGADGGGNVFPGPSMPFGMIKPGPDMDVGENDPNAGWSADGNIRGFSQTHVSGTGGGAKYGNILITPTAGAPSAVDNESPRKNEAASAGFYSVELTRFAIRAEITAARRTALYRFKYPAGQTANILFNVGYCLISGAKYGEGQSITSSEIRILSPTEVSGSSSVTGGWNEQPNSYTVYFYASTDTAAGSWGTWTEGRLQAASKEARGGIKTPSGAWLSFQGDGERQVMLKIGISFISIDQARANAHHEVNGFDFEATRAAAIAAWDKALGTVALKGETAEQASVFYTALYHTMLMPTDRTGENPLWKSDEPYYDDYYAIWDIFRTSGPLLTLIAPERQTEIVRALVDLYRHEGWLPDARSGNYNGRTQGGSNAEFMLTDAYVKGLPGIDWKTALAAEVHDAEVSPADHLKEGRGGLNDWHKLG